MTELATTKTEWPATHIPATLKNLMDHFFVIMNKNTPDAGDRLAAEFFTPEATFILSGGTYVGSEGPSTLPIVPQFQTPQNPKYLKLILMETFINRD
jgi:hypothetical protein